MSEEKKEFSRREFLKRLGVTTASTAAIMALDPISVFAGKSEGPKDPMLAASGMTYRIQRRTKDKVSLLGYGMMRLPQKNRRNLSTKR